MNRKYLILIFSLLTSLAHGGQNDCLKYENGKITSCDPNASIYREKKSNGAEIFASGSAANRLVENRFKLAENKILEAITQLKNRVFPVTEENGNIIGTAFRYNGRTLTALHVVNTASSKRPLYVYDTERGKPHLIRGYATLKREIGVVNSIDYYDDFCILEIPELDHIDSFELSPLPITKRFEYLEMSYPKYSDSLKEPTAFSSFVSLPRTGGDNLVVLNRNGQNTNSSGGPVIDIGTQQVRAMNIVLETPSNTVKALDLYYLNPRIEEAVRNGFVPTLSDYQYHFPHYSEEIRPPIGGRGGGP